MPELSQSTQKLISRYQDWYQSSRPQEAGAAIHVDEVASSVASFYEKMRSLIDWREQHLLRKTAIERILTRRLFIKKEGQGVAQSLVNELIRGGHFPNDTIAESKILDVQKLIDKYVFIINNGSAPQLHDWLMGIAACEIEEVLAPPTRENAIMDYMFEVMRDQIEVREGIFVKGGISQSEKDTQAYIAIQRALFKLDDPLISYNLLKKWYPDWLNLQQDEIEDIAKNIYHLYEKLTGSLKHPLAEKFYNLMERYDTPYLIIGDIVSADPVSAKESLKDPAVLEEKIRNAYHERLKKIKAKMGRAAFYSTLSIFLSKILVVSAVEIPFDKYITREFSYSALGLSVLVPPLLMFLLVISIRPPSKQNAEMVLMEAMKIFYERERKDIHEVRPSPKRGFFMNSVIIMLYLAGFVISFGGIIWGLNKLELSPLSILIFLIFTSLISFAGMKIRQRAKELVVEKEKETVLHILIDLLSLPVIRVGRWLSSQWMKYSAIVILFNSLLDMPFQVFIEFLEQWRGFLKEKKEEIH
jgi:hypothetical protein